MFSNRYADSGNSTQGLSRKTRFPPPIFGLILPAWIHFFNQRNLLFPTPAFDLLFAPNCNLHILLTFVVHKSVTLVLLGKPVNRIISMLMDALFKEAGDSDVKSSRAAGENIHLILVEEAVPHQE